MKRLERTLDYGTVTDHRRENCVHYEGCLEEASALLWQSFSCSECRLFMRRPSLILSYERAASPLAWEV
ncbi:MAG: hypothetical protein PHU25_20305 [Deltaproteobacteria bacterium]|nr:hypothetical protein [Deltaproteobacteria bacterium]